MPINDYALYDGLGLAGLVRAKHVTPLELVDAAIDRITRHNPAINAVIWSMFDRARDIAKAPLPPGPFMGVPFLLKDVQGHLAGAPTRQGSAFVPDTPMTFSSMLTNRFLAAGVIPLGKTNVPEFGLLPTTESRLYGPARNPWNTNISTGGSSGGSAAAVAAGIVPMAHANDGGGSIRIPASACGLVGLKPTRARTSFGPDLGEAWGGLESELIVSRSVRDTAVMLDAVAGGAAGDPYWAPPLTGSAFAGLADTKKLSVALIVKRPDGKSVHADCEAAACRAADICTALGHAVREVDPPAVWAACTNPWIVLFASSLRAQIDAISAATGAVLAPGSVEGLTLGVHAMAATFSAAQYQAAVNGMHAAGRAVAAWHKDFDVAITPTLGMPPIELGKIDINTPDPLSLVPLVTEYSPYTAVQNCTGQPALNLPLHWNAQGLPIGVHFIGRYGEEHTLLRLGAAIEALAPWADRHPPIWN